MEFIYNKDKQCSNEQSLEEMVNELESALIQVIVSSKEFDEQAMYNPIDSLPL